MVIYKVSSRDRLLISVLVARAAALHERCTGEALDVRRLTLDLHAAHGNNGNAPLDLVKLASSDDMCLAHDIFGVSRHMDRETGELTRHFVPKTAIFQESPHVLQNQHAA